MDIRWIGVHVVKAEEELRDGKQHNFHSTWLTSTRRNAYILDLIGINMQGMLSSFQHQKTFLFSLHWNGSPWREWCCCRVTAAGRKWIQMYTHVMIMMLPHIGSLAIPAWSSMWEKQTRMCTPLTAESTCVLNGSISVVHEKRKYPPVFFIMQQLGPAIKALRRKHFVAKAITFYLKNTHILTYTCICS